MQGVQEMKSVRIGTDMRSHCANLACKGWSHAFGLYGETQVFASVLLRCAERVIGQGFP